MFPETAEQNANRRKHIRSALRARVKLWCTESDESTWFTGDISDGGVYLLLENRPSKLKLGARVQIQVQGMPMEAPKLEAKVVRVDTGGLGLEFVL